MHKLSTPITKMLNIDVPIIGAPMFLVSNEDMVVAISEAGGIGTFPSLNYRPTEDFLRALKSIKQRTSKPIGVNIIVNKSNLRQAEDLKHSLNCGVELYITSLGNPKDVIREAHKNGAKVFCDVINIEQAKKVQDLGADAVVAVCSGAGGHAGPTTPMVLIPWLKEQLSIPVIAAGGIANGATMASAFCLGASAVHVGTRFIASSECQVTTNYKQAIINSSPEKIIFTDKVTGTPCNFIHTKDLDNHKSLPKFINRLKKNKTLKPFISPLLKIMGKKAFINSLTTQKNIWSAGQTVGLIHDIKPCKDIIEEMVTSYHEALHKSPR